MRTLVIGAGAVGGFFGAHMQAAGRDVSFLVRAGRAEQLRKNGLQVTSPQTSFTVKPQLVSAEELKTLPQAFDLILLSTKAYSLAGAMGDFAPAVGEQTAILPLLNGMRHIDALAERFGSERVLGGATRIVADMDAEGRIRSMEDLQDLVYGERNGEKTERIRAIEAALHGCGFEDVLSPDVMAFMWRKWVMLASLGSITCLLRGTIGEAAAAPGGAETATSIIRECAAIASAEGYPQPPEAMEMITERLTRPASPLTASMYRDLMKGQRVEADQIVGDLLVRAAKDGLDTPLLRAAYAQLSMYSKRLAAS